MQRLHQIILIAELLLIILPSVFLVVIGVFFFLSLALEHPMLDAIVVALLSLISGASTLAVGVIILNAINKIHHPVKVYRIWYYLVAIGFIIALSASILLLMNENIISVLYREVSSSYSAFELFPLFSFGAFLMIPALHSVLVLRYANSAYDEAPSI